MILEAVNPPVTVIMFKLVSQVLKTVNVKAGLTFFLTVYRSLFPPDQPDHMTFYATKISFVNWVDSLMKIKHEVMSGIIRAGNDLSIRS